MRLIFLIVPDYLTLLDQSEKYCISFKACNYYNILSSFILSFLP